jgi:choice-of-anchor B domain-containing protein
MSHHFPKRWIAATLSILLLVALLLTVRSSSLAGESAETNATLSAYMQRFIDDQQPVQDLEPLSATPCVAGNAGGYPCENVDLLAFMPLSTIGGGSGNDIWGWTDPLNGKEYALMGRSNGTAFVDISDPENPVYLGNLPTHSSSSSWRDVKVYDNHAFVVSEANSHGMQVFDLTRLRTVASPPVTFTEDAHYNGISGVHNIVINEDSGYAYSVGGGCSGGLHMIDISTPTSPTFAGCFSSDGYTHDAQCVNYTGPDSEHNGSEICFNANEDTLTIVDVTNKSAPDQLARVGYANSRYTHQVWVTEDQQYLMMGDELDEQNFGHNTRTFMWDISDLDAPVLLGYHTGATSAIDHNLYIKGDLAYESNYRAGLEILDISDIANANLSRVAYFDVYPNSNSASFNGSWSNYPFFDSGVVIVSGIEQGLFILQPTLAGDFSLAVEGNLAVCNNNDSAETTITLSAIDGYNDDVTLSTTGLPIGTSAAFDPTSVSVPGNSTMTLTANGTPPGNRLFAVHATDGVISHSAPAAVNILDGNLVGATLQTPLNGAIDVVLQPQFNWSAVANAATYEIQVATDSNFITIVAQESGINGTTHTLSSDLADDTVHYWRVRGSNTCGDGAWSAPFSFTTEGEVQVPAAVSISPTNSEKSELPDNTVTHTFLVTNESTAADNFTLAISGNDWTTNVQGATGSLGGGASKMIDVTVTIPSLDVRGEPPVILDSDQFTLTATSMNDGDVSAQASGTTNAISYPGVSVSADDTTQSALVGETVTYVLTITNEGDFTDSFAIALGSSNWTSTPSVSTVGPLAPGATGNVNVQVTVGSGNVDSVVVTAQSNLNPVITDNVMLVTSAILPGVEVTTPDDTQSATVGNTLTYLIDVKNTGNTADTFTISTSGNGWVTTLSDTMVELVPNQTATIEAYVTVGVGASDSVVVTAQSNLNPAISDDVTLTTSAILPGVDVTTPDDTQSATVGNTLTYVIDVKNTGNMTDTFTISTSGNGWVTTLSDTMVESLAPNQTATVEAYVTVGAGMSDSVVVRAQSDLNPAISDDVTLTTSAILPGVEVTTPDDAQSATVGNTLTYVIDVKNTGNSADTFTVSTSGNGWITTLSDTMVELVPNQTATIEAYVTVGAGASDSVVVTAQSNLSPEISDDVTLTTSAILPGVDVTTPDDTQSATVGNTLTYMIDVKNTGNSADTFTISTSGNGWVTTLSDTMVELVPNQTATIEAYVTVGAGASDSVVVTAQSNLSPEIIDDVTLITSAILPGVDVTTPDDTQSATSGNTLTYTIDVKNTGNSADTFTMSANDNSWATTLSDTTVGPLAPNETMSIEAYVVVGEGVSDSVVVSAESSLLSSVSDRVTLNSLSIVPGVTVAASTSAEAGLTGDVIQYELTVTNTGDTTDTFAITFAGDDWDTVVAPDTVGPLEPGTSDTVTVTVTIPASGLNDTVVVTATSSFVDTIFDTVALTTTAWRPAVSVSAPVATQTATTGGMVTYTVDIENSSNVTDTYALSVSGNGWTTTLSQADTGVLTPGESMSANVVVTLGAGLTDSVTVSAESSLDATVQDSIELTTQTYLTFMPMVMR